ncbi:hypothetical protein ACFP2T_38875 [Plantactinospora solaniradicis]|uniref:Uncharacterized protein n=1 Tax=Plantactinospora solaniradicis TaxID=1723736 RepID=A0ABW1KMQ7_9ACTN
MSGVTSTRWARYSFGLWTVGYDGRSAIEPTPDESRDILGPTVGHAPAFERLDQPAMEHLLGVR